MKAMKKTGKTYRIAVATCFLLAACQLNPAENSKTAEDKQTQAAEQPGKQPGKQPEEAKEPEKKAEETNAQPEKKAEEVAAPADKTEPEKAQPNAPAAETEEKKPETSSPKEQTKQPVEPAEQSPEMLAYTGVAWPEELTDALKEVDFSEYHFDVNNPQQIQDVNSLFVLANKANYFPESFEPIELVDPQSKHAGNQTRRKLRKVAADAIDELIAAAKNDGIDIQTVSGYRTIAYQKILYKSNVERQGVELANRYSSKPGFSEHHTGLCMDVSSASVGFDLIERYGETSEGKWLAENAHRYGFIIRYPKGKDNITGYSYEPWHIRYLGVPLATYLYQTGLCYEEFLALQQGKQPEEIVIK